MVLRHPVSKTEMNWHQALVHCTLRATAAKQATLWFSEFQKNKCWTSCEYCMTEWT